MESDHDHRVGDHDIGLGPGVSHRFSESSFIDVLVPKEKADHFAIRYGSDFKYVNGKPVLRSMRGVLRQINDAWFLEFGGE